MLTDIFLNRTADVVLWETFEEKDRRFLVQAFRIVSEQLYPYWTFEGRESAWAKGNWDAIHDKLSMELGLEELSARSFSLDRPSGWPSVHFHSMDTVCRNFVLADYDGSVSADRFMKERLSFFEIAFRHRAEEMESSYAERLANLLAERRRPQPRGGIRLPGDALKGHQAYVDRQNQEFRTAVDEFNARMREAG